MIARHYKWALNQVFHKHNYTAAIIVEGDKLCLLINESILFAVQDLLLICS